MLGDVAYHLVVSLATVLQPLVLLYEPTIMGTEGREMTSLQSLAVFKHFECAKKAGKRKAMRSLGERQLRSRLHGWLEFFVSPVHWGTGHCH